MKIIDGKAIKNLMEMGLKKGIKSFVEDGCRPPKLVVIQVGDYEESNRYVRQKKLACERIGMLCEHVVIPNFMLQQDIQATILNYNDDPTVDGIIVQLPIMMDNVNEREVLDTIDPRNDVDGLTTHNFGKLLTGEFRHNANTLPCTPTGIFSLLDEYYINSLEELKGMNVLIIGKGLTSGRPLVPMFMHYGANVINISSGCSEIQRVRYMEDADIIISCVGKHIIESKHLIYSRHRKRILINVGLHTDENGKLRGDYDLEDLKDTFGSDDNLTVTSIVGSTGILTVSHLLGNTFVSYVNNLRNS